MCTPSRVPTDVSTAQGTECPVGIAHSCSNHSGSLVSNSSGGGGCGGRRLKSKWRRQRLRREEAGTAQGNKQTNGRAERCRRTRTARSAGTQAAKRRRRRWRSHMRSAHTARAPKAPGSRSCARFTHSILLF